MERLLGNYSQYLYAIMRIVVGLLFACNGAQKLFGVFGEVRCSSPFLFPDGASWLHRIFFRVAYRRRVTDWLCRLYCER